VALFTLLGNGFTGPSHKFWTADLIPRTDAGGSLGKYPIRGVGGLFPEIDMSTKTEKLRALIELHLGAAWVEVFDSLTKELEQCKKDLDVANGASANSYKRATGLINTLNEVRTKNKKLKQKLAEAEMKYGPRIKNSSRNLRRLKGDVMTKSELNKAWAELEGWKWDDLYWYQNEGEGPFLNDEVRLLNTIATRIGHYIMYQKLKLVFNKWETTKQDFTEKNERLF